MSGTPQRPSSTRTRDLLEVVAAGAVAVAAGTYFTVQLTENKRRIAMDALQDSGFRIDPAQSKASSSKAVLVPETDDVLPPKQGEEQEDKTGEPNSAPEDAPGADEASEELEGSGGAFNPVTGEINWDCPCLGGMAHGPCGPEFREAFSCFVYSEDEPKGINCVEKFKNMQDCFRRHPEEYAEEIADDDEPLDEADEAPSPALGEQSEGEGALEAEETTSSTAQS